MVKLDNDWDDFLQTETQKPYYLSLRSFLATEYKSKTIYPTMHNIFNALKYTSYADTKVVVLGQDPYINEGEAHGLAFSVLPQAKTPPSLQNIFKEIASDVGCKIPNNGYLIPWAKQGVLLLNAVLTVEAKKSKSHARMGWEIFTTSVIQKLNEKNTPVVFLLWGKDAASKAPLITNPIHKIFIEAHPSPLAGGRFFGCKNFSKTNMFLEENGMSKIDWQIPDV